MGNVWREIASRAAMVVAGALFGAGGVGLWHFADVMQRYDYSEGAGRGYSHWETDSNLCFKGAWGLFGIAGIFIAGAVAPPSRKP